MREKAQIYTGKAWNLINSYTWRAAGRDTQLTETIHTHTHGQSRVSHQPNEHVFDLWEETVAPGENSQTIKHANITQKGSSQESS